MTDLILLLADPSGHDVAWDYCLEQNIIMPAGHPGHRPLLIRRDDNEVSCVSSCGTPGGDCSSSGHSGSEFGTGDMESGSGGGAVAVSDVISTAEWSSSGQESDRYSCRSINYCPHDDGYMYNMSDEYDTDDDPADSDHW